MRQPSCVIWALTKRHNSYLSKWQGNEFSHNPLNLTGFHNASQSASTIGVSGHLEKAKKRFRRVFCLKLAHKPRHHKVFKKTSESKQGYSHQKVKKEVRHTAKTIRGLTYQNEKVKTLALRRLARLSRSLHAVDHGEVDKKK